MSEQQAVAQRRGREGGRWLNERPTSEEFAEWWRTSMKIDPNLSHEDYVGGVVLIPAVDEKAKVVTGFNQKGDPVIDSRPELSYIPYAKVETRVAYFWDLIDAHEDWIGVVEHVVSPRPQLDFVNVEEIVEGADGQTVNRKVRQPSALTVLVHQLPDGFSIMSVPVGNNYSHFLCCTVRVSIFKRDENGEPVGRALRTGRGTKQTPLVLGRQQFYADPNSLMKAETGAMGRALGFAGIFVIPGSGVATAEDMMESLSQGTPSAQAEPEGNQGPAAPDAAPARTGAEIAQESEEEMRAKAIALYRGLAEESPAKAEEFGGWMKQRRHNSFGDIKGAALRGAVRKLEKLKDEADQLAQQSPTEEGGDERSSDQSSGSAG